MQPMTVLNKHYFFEFTSQELNTSLQLIHDKTLFKHLATWSSLNALLYLARIHHETGVLLSSAELSKYNTLQELFEQIISKQHGI